MSLALDLALVIRHSVNKLNLSVATRGVAYTLAFRIGTNICTWISQESLAKELGIAERNVRSHCKKLKECGLLLIEKDKKDSRKNIYSFTSEIYNYTQMNDEEKKKCRLKLGDALEDSGCFYPPSQLDTGRNHPVNTGQNHPVISCTNDTLIIDNKEEICTSELPKEKEQSKKRIKKKIGRSNPPPIQCPSEFKFNEEEEAICNEYKLDINFEFREFNIYYRDKRKTDWHKIFTSWLLRSVKYAKQNNKNFVRKESTIERGLRLCL